MKAVNGKKPCKLEELPNIGPAIANKLRLIGIDHPQQLIGQDPLRLYNALCVKTGIRYDPCLLDVFIAAVDFMEGAEATPWWAYTAKRKAMLCNK